MSVVLQHCLPKQTLASSHQGNHTCMSSVSFLHFPLFIDIMSSVSPVHWHLSLSAANDKMSLPHKTRSCLQASLLQRGNLLQSHAQRSRTRAVSASWTTSTCRLLLHSCTPKTHQRHSQQWNSPLLHLPSPQLCILVSPVRRAHCKLAPQALPPSASLVKHWRLSRQRQRWTAPLLLQRLKRRQRQ